MSKRDYRYWIELSLRRRAVALEAFAILFGLVVLVTAVWPPTYQSTAEILVQDNRAQLLVSPNLQDSSAKDASIVANPVSEEDMNSEVELLTSLYLIRRAIADFKPPSAYAGPGSRLLGFAASALALPARGYQTIHDTPNVTPQDKWAIKIANHLKATVILRSNVIALSYRSHDSQWSQEFLRRLINKYLEHHARISHDPEAQRFFEQQAELLKKRLQGSQERLRQFQIQTGISDLIAQKQALINQISGLQTQSSTNAAQLAAAERQVSALQAKLTNTPQRIGKETRSVQNQALSQLKPQIMQMQAERAELLSRYQPNSARIQEINAKLAAAQKILDRENHLEVQEQSTDLNPIWVTIDSTLSQAETNTAALEGGQRSLAAAIQDARQQMNDLVNSGVVLDRLESQAQTDQDAYLSYVRKSEEARAAQALNFNKILNVSVAQPPELPLLPAFPMLWLNLIAGLIVAAGAAIGAAYWEERTDEKLYTLVDIESVSGLNTIAVLRNDQ